MLRSEMGDAFVWHGIDNEREIARYLDAAVNWVCNCFRRKYLRWPESGLGDGRITDVVRGMMIAIDELTISASILKLAQRAIPLLRENRKADQIADALGTDLRTAERLKRLPIQLCLQDVLSESARGGAKLKKAQSDVARRIVAGMQRDRIAAELRMEVDRVDQIVTAVLRKHCLPRARRAGRKSREHQRWIELAEAEMQEEKIAAHCGVKDCENKTGVETVRELLTRVVRFESLENLVQHGKARVRWHALLPLAVSGRKRPWQAQERRDLLTMARILIGVKHLARSQVEVRRAYANGMAELQEAWEGDATCRMAASCLEWHDGEALRRHEECGFPETYGEWGNCNRLVNPHPDDGPHDGDAFRRSRNRLKVVERCETQVGHEYGAVARRLLSTQLPRVMRWWKDPGGNTEEEAKRILEETKVHEAINTLERLEGPKRKVTLLATLGTRLDEIPEKCGETEVNERDVYEILNEVAAAKPPGIDTLCGAWEK